MPTDVDHVIVAGDLALDLQRRPIHHTAGCRPTTLRTSICASRTKSSRRCTCAHSCTQHLIELLVGQALGGRGETATSGDPRPSTAADATRDESARRARRPVSRTEPSAGGALPFRRETARRSAAPRASRVMETPGAGQQNESRRGPAAVQHQDRPAAEVPEAARGRQHRGTRSCGLRLVPLDPTSSSQGAGGAAGPAAAAHQI